MTINVNRGTCIFDGRNRSRQPIQVFVAGATDIGRVRRQNEDSYLVSVNDALVAVADGLGGHGDGEVASKIAVEALINNDLRRHSPLTPLSSGFHLANEKVHRHSKSLYPHRINCMATTLVAGMVIDGELMIANVGDSRAYQLLPDKTFRQLTKDHSLVQKERERILIAEPSISESDLENRLLSVPKNIVTRCVGIESPDQFSNPDCVTAPLLVGAIYLFCSDGLTNMLQDQEIAKILQNHRGNPEKAAETLIQEANAAGGRDNITAVVVEVFAGSGSTLGLVLSYLLEVRKRFGL